MKVIQFCLALLGGMRLVQGEGVLTDAMQKGLVKLGEACMKSVGATIEEMNALKNNPPYTGKTACVLSCILEKAGVMEKKRFSKQGLVRAAVPFVMTDPKKLKKLQEIAGICENEIKSTDENECEAANHIVMCLRKNIPQLAELKF